MTNEEAIELINSDVVNYERLTDARKIATEALEKQIPKESKHLNAEELTVECPSCGFRPVFALADYCSKCGQRLKSPFKKVIR